MQLERILYVEDDPDIQMVAKMALEKIGGFTLTICSSGPEALEKAAAFEPQLILLDSMMPGMDGPTTLQELRKLPEMSMIPVVFMTAKIQPQEIEYYKTLGALDVIKKPFDPMQLSAQITAIWQKEQ